MLKCTTVLIKCLLVLTQDTQFPNGGNTLDSEIGKCGVVQENQDEGEIIPRNETNSKLFLEAKYFQRMKPGHFKRSVVTKKTSEPMFDVDFDPKIRTDGYQRSRPEEGPYAVYLIGTSQPSGKIRICSGSLLTVEWVLTSTHCMYPEKSEDHVAEIRITAGGSSILNETSMENIQQTLAEKLIPHQEYFHYSPDIMNINFDIMLIKTKDKFRLTKYIGTIELSSSLLSTGYTDCVVVGFGRVFRDTFHEDDYKRKTHKLTIEKPCTCGLVFDKQGRFLCVRPREDYGVCKGDSGSGLVCDGKLQAVFTTALNFNPSKGCQRELEIVCGSANSSDVFLETVPFLSWISEHVEDDLKSQTPKTCSPPLGLMVLSFVLSVAFCSLYKF